MELSLVKVKTTTNRVVNRELLKQGKVSIYLRDFLVEWKTGSREEYFETTDPQLIFKKDKDDIKKAIGLILYRDVSDEKLLRVELIDISVELDFEMLLLARKALSLESMNLQNVKISVSESAEAERWPCIPSNAKATKYMCSNVRKMITYESFWTNWAAIIRSGGDQKFGDTIWDVSHRRRLLGLKGSFLKMVVSQVFRSKLFNPWPLSDRKHREREAEQVKELKDFWLRYLNK